MSPTSVDSPTTRSMLRVDSTSPGPSERRSWLRSPQQRPPPIPQRSTQDQQTAQRWRQTALKRAGHTYCSTRRPGLFRHTRARHTCSRPQPYRPDALTMALPRVMALARVKALAASGALAQRAMPEPADQVEAAWPTPGIQRTRTCRSSHRPRRSRRSLVVCMLPSIRSPGLVAAGGRVR